MKPKHLLLLMAAACVITTIVLIIFKGETNQPLPPTESQPAANSPAPAPPKATPTGSGILIDMDTFYEKTILEYQNNIHQTPPYLGEPFIGHVLAENQEFEDAIAACQRALQTDPKDLNARYTLGWTYAVMGEDNKAIEACIECLKLNPTYTRATILKAWMAAKAGQLDEAMALCQKAAAADPENPTAVFGIGHIYALQGKFAEAAEAFGKVLALKRIPLKSIFTLG